MVEHLPCLCTESLHHRWANKNIRTAFIIFILVIIARYPSLHGFSQRVLGEGTVLVSSQGELSPWFVDSHPFLRPHMMENKHLVIVSFSYKNTKPII